MNAAEIVLWTVGLLLQMALLIAMFKNGFVRRFRVFTFLIAFYVVRSAVLFFVFGHLAPAQYLQVFEVTSVADVCLQILVGSEIALLFLNEHKDLPLRLGAVLAGLAAAVAAVTTATVGVIRSKLMAGAVLVGIVMLFLALWMAIARFHGAARRVAEGFAAFEALFISADATGRHAVLHRMPSLWVAAEWTKSAAWIAVVVFWLFVLGSGRSTLRSNGSPSPPPAEEAFRSPVGRAIR